MPKKLKEYKVTYRETVYTDVYVRANNKDDAIDRADTILTKGETERCTVRHDGDMEVQNVSEVRA